jgi:hypothetical protein
VVAVEPGAGLGTLKAVIAAPTPSSPKPSYKYQWYRDDALDGAPAAPILDATASSYKLTTADYMRTITVRVTMTRTNFTVPVQVLALPTATDYSIQGDGIATVTGIPATGETLHAEAPQFLEADNSTDWCRPRHTPTTGTAARHCCVLPPRPIRGAEQLGRQVDSRQSEGCGGGTALSDNALVQQCDRTRRPRSAQCRIDSDDPRDARAAPVLKVDASGAVLPTSEGSATLKYAWYRSGVRISGATGSKYTPVKADAYNPISVVITATRPGYQP